MLEAYLMRIWLAIFLFVASTAFAIPRKGFYKGPYITLSTGTLQFNWDQNQRTLINEGRKWEPVFHLGFGWNIIDFTAIEMQARFTTNGNGGRREQIAGASLGPNFSLIWKPLIDFESLRILPFLYPAFAVEMISLPGDPTAANNNRLTSIGVGGSFTGGIRCLYHEYFYLGLEGKQNLIHHEDAFQLLASGTNALIYPGGWQSEWEFLGMVGVHF